MNARLGCMGAVLWLALATAGPLMSAPNVLVPAGSVWKFLPITNDVGTAWRESDFDDRAWASGPAQLGYGDQEEVTVVPFLFDPDGGKNISTYFRHAFRATTIAQVTNLLVRLLRDDGAVVYLNGVEIFRSNMPGGPVDYRTYALQAIPTGPEENSIYFPTNVFRNLLSQGTNTLAVEIHQITQFSSTDMSFDCELAAFPTDDATRLRVIRLGSLLQISWPMWTERLILQTTTNLTPSVQWTVADTHLVKDLNGFRYVELPDESTDQRFFRLKAD